MSVLSFQAEADGLQTHVADGRFHARATLNDAEERDGITYRAVASAKAGDREAFRYLYVRYADNVYGYILSIVRDEHEAEDLTQQLFLKLMTVITRYERRSAPFVAWMLRLARNVAIDHMRAPARRLIPCGEVAGAGGGTDPNEPERALCLKEALASLPHEQRSVLILRHVAGLSPGEIARTVGRSEPSIHGLHHRGRRAIQGTLLNLDSAPVTASGRGPVA